MGWERVAGRRVCAGRGWVLGLPGREFGLPGMWGRVLLGSASPQVGVT